MNKVSSKPNILLLLIDSLRADRLYQTKFKTAKTPNMDSLIKNGICFSQAISSSDGTVFSMATVLTGSYPYKTKVASNRLHKIHSKVKTYVTLLRESGYNTYSITYDTKGVHRFAQDFEHKTPYSIGSNLYNGLGNRIIKFIDSLKDPWLLYIHLEDLHAPFKAPSEFDNDKYGMNQYDRIISGIDSWLGRVLEKIGLNERYESNNRYKINTHSFRAYGITKISRHDPNFGKKIAGQKGYLLQYDRISDEEKLEIYQKYEIDLIIDNTEKQKAKIKKLEEDNNTLEKMNESNMRLARKMKRFEYKDSITRKDIAKIVYDELEKMRDNK